MAFSAKSQTVITNSTFPQNGDQLNYASLSIIDFDLDMKSTAGPHEWDFNVLNKGYLFTENYVDVSQGSASAMFPDANLLLKSQGEERYLDANNNNIRVLGFGGINPLFQIPLTLRYTEAPLVRVAPLEFVNTTSTSSVFNIAISTEIFPDSIKALFPAGFEPDSVKIQFENISNGILDAYGTLEMQGQSFDVLREKVTENTDTKVFIKLPIIGWVDLGAFAGGTGFELPESFQQFIGVHTSTIYRFHTDTRKEILVSATYNEENALTNVVFADLGNVVAGTQEVVSSQMELYPNPAQNILNISIPNWESGSYLLTVSDIKGGVIKSEIKELSQNGHNSIDVSHLNPGNYILTLRNNTGKIVRSAQFIVVK